MLNPMPSAFVGLILWFAFSLVIWLPVRVIFWIVGYHNSEVLFYWGFFSASWPLWLWMSIYLFARFCT
jgi:hypothetical protein